jgi:DHA1 family bicyclomycin/chloramphenicol resistance-like MFS transporter
MAEAQWALAAPARRMKLKAGSLALTALLALLTSLGPLSTDMYLPSLPAIGRFFSASTSSVQLTLSLFLAGFAAGQIIYGPLSDAWGRKPVLTGGLLAFLIATLGCALAPSMDLLIAARFAQAVGACAAVVLARAIVRDLYEASDAARMLSMMGALMGLVPAIGPVLGGVLETQFGWRASFVLSAVLAFLLILSVALLLPETLAADRRGRVSFARMRGDFALLVKSPVFRRYAGAVCLAYGGLFAFISGSSFVLQQHYGLTELQFGLSFALCVGGYIAGTLLAIRYSTSHGISALLFAGTIALAVGGVSMVILMSSAAPQVWHVLLPMVIYMVGVGLALPQSTAGAITPFPLAAGTASSLMGFCQMTFAALVGIVTAAYIDDYPAALGWVIAGLGVANLALALLWRARGEENAR